MVYTDGACRDNPGIGGWGVLIIDNENKHTLKGSQLDTTNNRMELTAAIKALEFIDFEHSIVLYTDSEYVMKGITEWISGWKSRSWRTASKKPVKNVDLWKKLDVLVQGRSISWNWVRGHSGDEGNELADGLANAAIDELIRQD